VVVVVGPVVPRPEEEEALAFADEETAEENERHQNL
jgi:hypothetical protein